MKTEKKIVKTNLVTMDREEAEEVHRKWATPPEPEITPEPQLQTNYQIVSMRNLRRLHILLLRSTQILVGLGGHLLHYEGPTPIFFVQPQEN